MFFSHVSCKPRPKVSRLAIKTYGTHAPNINKHTFTSTEVKHYAFLEVTHGKAPTFSGIRRLIYHYFASTNNFCSADSEFKSRSFDRTSLGFCTSNYSLPKISDNYPYTQSTINSRPTSYTARSQSSILCQVSLNQILNVLNIHTLRPALFWNITQRMVVIPHRRFGTTYRSHLQGLRKPRRC